MDECVEATQLASKWWQTGLNLVQEYRVPDTMQQTPKEKLKTQASNPAHLATTSRTDDLPFSIYFWS